MSPVSLLVENDGEAPIHSDWTYRPIATKRSGMLPKIIWWLWFQGSAEAPELVRACGASWRRHNPDWTIRYLSRDTLIRYLDPSPDLKSIFDKNLPLQALSNVLRIELLSRFGGVWADATTYCLRPLNDWVDHATRTGFFAFARPAPDRMLSNWFIAAEPGSYIVDVWRKKTSTYWSNRQERHHYFWHHYLFADAYETDERFKAIWDATPKMPAGRPCYFIPYEQRLFKPFNERDRVIVETAWVPLLKLTHKLPSGRDDRGTTFRWLCDRMKPWEHLIEPEP